MWMGGGGKDTYLRRIKSTKERMSASVKQIDWSLSESPFAFGNRYKFILCCQQRGIIRRVARDSLAEV